MLAQKRERRNAGAETPAPKRSGPFRRRNGPVASGRLRLAICVWPVASGQLRLINKSLTFASAPALFWQLYDILARRGKWVFPVLHCLLTCKSQPTYEKMFDMVRNRWPTFSPTNASMDFEQAMVSALRAKHPQCSINFCLFPLTQLAQDATGPDANGQTQLTPTVPKGQREQ
ncbi:hypothetical protein niasHS_001111 [Heterodera schachtii]|uniref:MULE transposase domain-containing protein n=1 Tax=Heterodera schachtii TaxID=97005 RepID=A0ABD2KC68_HETSC